MWTICTIINHHQTATAFTYGMLPFGIEVVVIHDHPVDNRPLASDGQRFQRPTSVRLPIKNTSFTNVTAACWRPPLTFQRENLKPRLTNFFYQMPRMNLTDKSAVTPTSTKLSSQGKAAHDMTITYGE